MGVWEYDRKELLAKLKLIQPALPKAAAAAVAPPFTNLWFTGQRVLAANGIIAMTAELDDGPVLGVRGHDLIKLLGTSVSPTVTLTSTGNGQLGVKTGFKVTLVRTTDVQPFKWTTPPNESIEVNEAILAALKLAHDIMDPLAMHRQAQGVTVVRDDAGTVLYATDRNVMVRYAFDQPGDGEMVIVNFAFVAQMLRLGDGRLTLSPDHSQYVAGPIGLWGRYLIPEIKGISYEPTFRERRMAHVMPLPDEFFPTMERASILAGEQMKEKPIKVEVRGNKMLVESVGPYGAHNAKLDFKHPDVTLHLDVPLVEKLAKHQITKLGMTQRSLLFTNGDGSIEYLMASQEDKAKAKKVTAA